MANQKKTSNQKPPGPPGKPGPGKAQPPKFSRSILGWVVGLMLAALLIAMLFNDNWDRKTWDMSEFRLHKESGQIIEKVIIRDSTIEGEATIDGEVVKFRVELPASVLDYDFVAKELDAGERPVVYEFKRTSPLLQILVGMLPWVIILGVVWFLLFRQMRGAAGGGGILGNFGRSRHKLVTKERTNVTFQDVAGIEEAKEEVTELIEFLRNPGKFQRLGGRIPRGVLLIGAPGTGKTLLARAIAGEANAPFLHISGSDFVEMFVGVGASRVRDLFKQAKDASPCIIFLDEIDAVGRRRGVGFNGGGGHDEREQTLNAILVEMDGFDSNDQVIVIAATNRADVLDPALTRPGRFDRQVYIPLPDIKGRLEILKVHARKVKLSPDADLGRLARGTGMLAGADLAAIINEAAIGATMTGKDAVELSDLEEARDKMHWGRARKSQVIDESEKKITAFHEAGHALATHLLPEAEPLHKVSIIPRGQALGATFQLPEKDRHLWTKRRIISEIQVALAGRAAEEAFCDDISSGAAEDIRKATALARWMVCDWGMSEKVGLVRHAREASQTPWGEIQAAQEVSDETSRVIDEEIKRFLDESHKTVQDMLAERKEQLQGLAEALLKYETLDVADVERIFKGESLEKPTVADLIEKESKKDQEPAEESKDDTQQPSEST